MPVKTKKHYEINLQRGRRSKLQGLINMKFTVYDDSSFNDVFKKKHKWKPIRGIKTTFINKTSSRQEKVAQNGISADSVHKAKNKEDLE